MTQPNPAFDTTEPEPETTTESAPVPDATANSGRHAAEQAKDNSSVFAPHTLRFDDGSTIEIPPSPVLRLLDDDRLAEYDALMFEAESYDRGPDIFIPEQTIKDTAGNEIKLPAETKQGPLLTPYRKTDAEGVARLITPPHEVRVAQAVLGPALYEKLRSGMIKGRRGCAADVWRIWNTQGLELAERQRNDSKSDAGSGVLETVPEADSQ